MLCCRVRSLLLFVPNDGWFLVCRLPLLQMIPGYLDGITPLALYRFGLIAAAARSSGGALARA